MNIKKLALHITLVLLPILVGCMPINRQQTTPTDTFSGTPSYSTTSMLTDFSPTVTTTSPTPPVTDTASSGDINWAEGIRPVFSSPYLRIYATHRNLWSPTSNEILIDCHEERTHIVTLGAPDFETVVLANDSGCWDAAWSPDGMSVAYVNGANDILIATPKTGEAFRANKRNSLRIPINLSWIDSQKLIYGEYMGGGHVNFREFDILSGEEYDIAQVPGGDLVVCQK